MVTTRVLLQVAVFACFALALLFQRTVIRTGLLDAPATGGDEPLPRATPIPAADYHHDNRGMTQQASRTNSPSTLVVSSNTPGSRSEGDARTSWTGAKCLTGSWVATSPLLALCERNPSPIPTPLCPSQEDHHGAPLTRFKCGHVASGTFTPAIALPPLEMTLSARCRASIASALQRFSPVSVDATGSSRRIAVEVGGDGTAALSRKEQQFRNHSSSGVWRIDGKENQVHIALSPSLLSGCSEAEARTAATALSTPIPASTPEPILEILRRAVKAGTLPDVQPLGWTLFTGDSMMRQMWLRLISLVRGQREAPTVEHYFHNDALYVVWPDADVLVPFFPPLKSSSSSKKKKPQPTYPPQLAEGDSSVRRAYDLTEDMNGDPNSGGPTSLTSGLTFAAVIDAVPCRLWQRLLAFLQSESSPAAVRGHEAALESLRSHHSAATAAGAELLSARRSRKPSKSANDHGSGSNGSGIISDPVFAPKGFINDLQTAVARFTSTSPQSVETEFPPVLWKCIFEWQASTPAAFRPALLALLRPPLYVASWMYWWQKKHPLSDIETFLDVVTAFHLSFDGVQANAGGSHVRPSPLQHRTVLMTTPWTLPDVFGGLPDDVRLPRNERIRSWIFEKDDETARRRTSSRGSAQRILLDYAAISRLKEFPKTHDRLHYSCIMRTPAPQLATEFKTTDGDAMVAASGDPARRRLANVPCIDWMNQLVVDQLLRLLEYS